MFKKICNKNGYFSVLFLTHRTSQLLNNYDKDTSKTAFTREAAGCRPYKWLRTYVGCYELVTEMSCQCVIAILGPIN